MSPAAVSSTATLYVQLDPRINYAIQQNDIPPVKSIRIDNISGDTLRDIDVSIRSDPAFAEPWSARIASIPEGGSYNLRSVDLRLAPGFLNSLSERVRGQITFEARVGDSLLTTKTEPVELLARDEWSGISGLPEILAAFVLPNHPVVADLLRDAADILGSWSGDPSLSGYQSKDSQRIGLTVASVYAAIQKLNLTYVNPPASFESTGQRIRLPAQIAEDRLSTCLDVALLAAACIEQCGLNALVVLVEGHAFTGAWLTEECFPEPTMDDGLRLRKRVELYEVIVFDPTCATTRPSPGFDIAVSEGRRRLEDTATFSAAIDIARARKGRIRPLPEMAPGSITPVTSDISAATGPEVPAMPSFDGLPGAGTEGEAPQAGIEPETAATRIDKWKRKLLDLSLRNRLLNFRDSKKTLPLLCPDLATFENKLASGRSFQIRPRPRDLGEADPRDPDTLRRRTGEEGLAALLREELDAGRIYVDVTEADLSRRLTEMFRAARTELEEGGASALYLAVGFLNWYQTEKTDQVRRAPLLLLPMELKRQSVRHGFSLKQADEDPRFNVTLLEMLKQDFGLTIEGVDPLPGDDSGVDVKGVLRNIRKAVRDMDRWEVVLDVRIGFFSFTKFLMWRDLSERTEDLLKNGVVDHLVNRPEQPFDPGGSFPDPARLDDERAPTETFCPLPADSSQLAAVIAAAEGRSFVLEGPPGTGKSQTIANLIAHCLAEGKTVLFVSEKMAALDVVHRRLTHVGLGRFCLELHSNKARKAEVLEQLGSALSPVRPGSEDLWSRTADTLAGLRNGLNDYVRALHDTHPSGDSVFRATSRLIGLRDCPSVPLTWASPEAVDARTLDQLRDIVDQMATAMGACGMPAGHPLELIAHEEWSHSWQSEAMEAVTRLGRAVDAITPRAKRCAKELGLERQAGIDESGGTAAAGGVGSSLTELELMGAIEQKLMESPGPPPAMVTSPDWESIQADVGAWIVCGRKRDQYRAAVQAEYRDEIIARDLEGLKARLQDASQSWWLPRWWKRRPVVSELRSVSLTAKSPPSEALEKILDLAIQYRDEQRKLDHASDQARALLGQYWQDGEATWDDVEKLQSWTAELRSLASRVAGTDFARAEELRAKWAALASEGRTLLAPDAQLGQEFRAFRNELEELFAARRATENTLDLVANSIDWLPDAPDSLERTRSLTVGWKQAESQLHDWCAWRRIRTTAVKQDLAPLIQAVESGSFGVTELSNVFERSYARWWVSAIVDREPVLRGFFSAEHQRQIEQFRSRDEEYMALTRSLIRSRLAKRLPSQQLEPIPTSDMGILRREMTKKRRHMPIRQLLSRIRNLLPLIKPCFLMSPISVAQYLDAAHPPFDLVVFDEASQIPVWDSVGAIARGRQAIVVGDPKQLPPTNFFARAVEEEEDPESEVVEDLESILDDCIGAQIPLLPLNWHYRSRHESLIAFSNYQYYENRLLTFPSPRMEGMGVAWRHVPDGVYDKGKSRTNRAEALAVVAEIRRRLTAGTVDPIGDGTVGRSGQEIQDPQRGQQGPQDPRAHQSQQGAMSAPSIGVVTFSQAQQTLIEDLLDEERRKNPDLERFFSDDQLEPVFVKNLENVQGDERDVILFSICYGPDLTGKIAMNFGPLNRDGGERRLNVAITRAKQEVIVFSTLRAEQIDLSRTQARGVRDLQLFLDYAERGPVAIAEATTQHIDGDFESPFEEAVYDALSRQGWTVHKQVGCARYRIDLAVVDPDAAGRYLLGIECDGANYHRAKTARDRDKLREEVLRGLGWELHRIWSTDWWTNPKKEVEKVLAALEKAKNRDSGAGSGAGIEEVVATDGREEGDSPSVREVQSVSGALPTGQGGRDGGPSDTGTVRPGTTPESHDAPFVTTPPPVPLPEYRETTISAILGTKESFYEDRTTTAIRSRIAEVVKMEGPISFSLTTKRVSSFWGLERAGKRVAERVRSLVPKDQVVVQVTSSGEFLWPAGVPSAQYSEFRVPATDGSGTRAPGDIPVEELANAALFVLRSHVSAPESDLVQSVARVLGFQRTGRVVEGRVLEGIRLLEERGVARRDGEQIVLQQTFS